MITVTLKGHKGEETVTMVENVTVREIATQRYNLFGKNKKISLNGTEVPWDTRVKGNDVVQVG